MIFSLYYRVGIIIREETTFKCVWRDPVSRFLAPHTHGGRILA